MPFGTFKRNLDNLVLLDIGSASNVALIEFKDFVDPNQFDAHRIEFINWKNATDNQTVHFQLSDDNGVGYLATGYDWDGGAVGVASNTEVNNDTEADLTYGAIGNDDANDERALFLMDLFNMYEAEGTFIYWNGFMYNSSTNLITVAGSCQYTGTEVIDAIKFYVSSGNIASVRYKLWGLKKNV